MLSNQSIRNILINKEIEITVSFYQKESKCILYDMERPLLESDSADNLYSDRLKLTMGPIIKPINKNNIIRKHTFKKTKDCVDLRKNDNKYIINPGESIIILTNERIKLNGKYACIIIPRISLSDVGVVVTTAYVDPYYQGIMRLQLSNLSNKSLELHSLEVIAQCFFFELTDEVSSEYKEAFSAKSVFYGQTWKQILESDRPPFPTKKGYAENNRFSAIKHQISIVIQFFKNHSIIFLLLTNIIAIVSGYTLLKQDYIHYKDTVSQIESWLDPVASEIVIDSGLQYGEKEITVDIPKAEIITVLFNNDNIQFELFSGNVSSETRIVFSYTDFSPTNNRREIEFTYVVVRRAKK